MFLLPFDVLNLILEYDGRIKYSHKERMYVNIISKLDWRYAVVDPKIGEKCLLVTRMNCWSDLKYFVDVYYKNSEIGLVFCKKVIY